MAGFIDGIENSVLSHFFRNTSVGSPIATIYAALLTTAPNEAGSGAVEASWGGYARKAVTFGAPSAGTMANTAAVTFDKLTSGSGTPVAIAFYDAASAGNLIAWFWLAGAPKTFTGIASTDVIQSPGHGLSDTNEVIVVANPGEALPAGLTEGTKYFVRDGTTDTFKLATTSGGAAIDLTASGVGRVCLDKRKAFATDDTPEFAIGAIDLTPIE